MPVSQWANTSPTASLLNARALPPAASLGAAALGEASFDVNGEFIGVFFLLRDAKSPKSLVRVRELEVFSCSEGQP